MVKEVRVYFGKKLECFCALVISHQANSPQRALDDLPRYNFKVWKILLHQVNVYVYLLVSNHTYCVPVQTQKGWGDIDIKHNQPLELLSACPKKQLPKIKVCSDSLHLSLVFISFSDVLRGRPCWFGMG